MADVKYIRKETDTELNNVEIEDGQLLYTKEGHVFMDYDNERVPMQNTPDNVMSDSSNNSVSNSVIKSYIDNSINTLNGEMIKAQLLWENPSPTTNFTILSINLDNSDYDILEFFYKYKTDSEYLLSMKTVKGYGCSLIENAVAGSGLGLRRFVNRISDLTYEVQAPSGNSTISDNPLDFIIPIYVVGYKTNVFD